MKVFLAGIVSRPWLMDDYMKLFLASPNTGSINKHIKNMKLYLATPHSYPSLLEGYRNTNKICILESFAYVADWMDPYIKDHWDFLLDSGAFTFMSSTKKPTNDWNEYVDRYSEYINKNKIEHFFELDIDSVIGLKEVEKLRTRLERLTEKQCIPVWHRARGKQYWFDMVKEYNYISIGGIVTKEIQQKDYKVFHYLLKEAKKQKCKVHGLGFTNLKGMVKYPFYSVDSTAWVYGNRGGFLYKFNGKTMEKIIKPEGTRLKSKKVAINNFNEWIKFQKYAKRYL